MSNGKSPPLVSWEPATWLETFIETIVETILESINNALQACLLGL